MLITKGNQVQITPKEGGPLHWAHIRDVKYVLPADEVILHLPLLNNTRRKSTLNIRPDQQPDLGWQLATTLNTVHPPTTQVAPITSFVGDYSSNNVVTITTTTPTILPM